MSSGFPGFLPAPNRAPNFIRFDKPGTYSFTVPGANGFIIDVFGAGGSGGAVHSIFGGGGGGARHRCVVGPQLLKAGIILPIVVGAGGTPTTAGTNGVAGGKSSFGLSSNGTLFEAYGGGGGSTSGGGGGGGIAGVGGGSGLGGLPNIRTTGSPIVSFNANASSDYGGGNADNTSITGNAVWGGGAGGSTSGAAGNSLYAGGGGAGGIIGNFGAKSGFYGNILNSSVAAVDGIQHALLGGGGSGGGSATGTGLNGVAGGFPGGGGGGTDNTGGFSGKGGDGLVVVYWW